MKHAPPSPTIRANPSWRVGIVAAPFYKEETEAIIASAKSFLLQSGIPEEHVTVHLVPGSFEVPLIGSALAKAKKVDALIGIGIVVQGETFHANLLAQEATRGMMEVQLQYQIPFAFEILWVNDIAQARERGHKGAEAANAVVQSLAELERVRS